MAASDARIGREHALVQRDDRAHQPKRVDIEARVAPSSHAAGHSILCVDPAGAVAIPETLDRKAAAEGCIVEDLHPTQPAQW